MTTSEALQIIDEVFNGDPSRFADAELLLATAKDKLRPLMQNAKHLTKSDVKSGDVVRFRGMVQNCHGIEMYAPVFLIDFENGTSQKMTGVGRDGAGHDNGTLRVDEMAPTSGRMVYNVMPIPGEAHWLTSISTNSSDDVGDCGIAKRLKLDDSLPQLHTIRIYSDADEFLQHQIVEFCGIYQEPIDATADSGLPQSIFGYPSVHVVEHRLPKYIDLIPQSVVAQRDHLAGLSAITASLLGSNLAASYFLRCLASHTYSWREDTAVPLCSLPLNISGVTSSRCIIETLKMLVPMVQVVSVTKKTLEEKPLFSVKDHDTDGLSLAPLQVARGTVLVLDITEYKDPVVRKPDNFVDKNLAALGMLVEEQKIAYDFGVFQHSVQTDITVVALNGDCMPFLKKAAKVIAAPFEDGIDPSAELHKLDSGVLHGHRRFLAEARERVPKVDIPSEVQREICQSFTSIREEQGASAPEYFRSLLCLARLQTALEQKTEMSADIFHACARQEKERLDVLKKGHR